MIQKLVFFKKIFFTLILGFILVFSPNIYAVPKLRIVTGPGVWAAGRGLDGSGLFDGINFEPLSTLKFNISRDLDFNQGKEIIVKAVDLNNQNNIKFRLTFGNHYVGSIVDLSGNQQADIIIDHSLTTAMSYLYLTGESGDELGIKTGINNYTGISNIIFEGKGAGALIIDSTEKTKIIFNGKFIKKEGAYASLEVWTDFTVTDPSIDVLGAINISYDPKPAIFTIDVGATGDIALLKNGATIQFAHKDSTLQFYNDKGGSRTVFLHSNLAPQDKQGIVEVHVNGIGNELQIKQGTLEKEDNAAIGSIGSKNLPLTKLTVKGDSIINIDTPVFAQEVAAYNTSVSHLTFKQDVTANINFYDSSTMVTKSNITGNIDFKNFDSQIMLADNTKITGDVISTGGTNGGLNFEGIGEVAGTIGADNTTIKQVNISKDIIKLADVNAENINNNGIIEFAGVNARTREVPSLTIDKDQLKRSIEKFNYNTKINVKQFNNNENGRAHFINATFVEEELRGGELEFKDDIWLNNAIIKANKVTFGPNKSTILTQNIEASNIIADQAKIVILENMSIIGDFTAKDMSLDLGNKKVTITDSKKFSGNMEINTSYDSEALRGGYIDITDGGKVQFSEVDQMIINVIIKSDINQVPIGTRYNLVRAKTDSSIEGKPKNVVLNIKDQDRFTHWEIDQDSKNFILYSKPAMKSEQIQTEEDSIIVGLKEQAKQAQDALDKAKQNKEALEKEKATLAEQASKAQGTLAEVQGKLELANTDKNALENDKKQLTADLAQAKADVETKATLLKDKEEQVKQALETLEKEKATLAEQASKAQGTLAEDLVQAEAEIETKDAEIYAQELAQAKAELANIKAEAQHNLHLASGVTNKLERPTIQQALNQNAEQKEFADQLINVTDSASDATKFTNSLNLFNSSIEDVREAADRLITRNISPNIVMWESLRDMNQPADQRMLELQAMIQRPVVSAGNDDQAKQTSRIWVAPFAARGTQKLDSVNNGYKSNIQGGTLGADYSMNASFLIGAAYSRLNTNIKYQGTKIGDKTKAHTNIMSLYVLVEI